MDSLTQFVLGAGIATLALGPRLGPRRAALIGGVVGTLPDLDVFLASADPIQAFVTHRGFSHSVFVHTLVAPLIGEALLRLDKRLRDARWLTWLTVWLTLVTHALLDCFTTYGTRILWPLDVPPVSWSSIFIIDPLYTLPLLALTLVALFRGRWGPGIGKAAIVALSLSTLYLGWSVAAREIAEAKVRSALAAAGQPVERLTMIPMPFNTVLWRGLAMTEDGYVNVYRSIFDDRPDAPLHRHPNGHALEAILPDKRPVEAVADFSRGYYAMAREGDTILVRDLRMGVEPHYIFTFEIARQQSTPTMIPPVQRPRVNDTRVLDWMVKRFTDEDAVRAE
ncbi:metal-dependent hydrolase [Oceanibaculum pacificum]|uniref:Hydrolase n=1 Tax=Oceanibaculum pacificum TaxID=580166 RepID=A0A154W1F6_9PROT|nr:metal-dependent hydrolase [Oceanibaculum pacificum]KZD07293.1 hypothetical protein AUP43_10265 [Oceanibaculum pacificum]